MHYRLRLDIINNIFLVTLLINIINFQSLYLHQILD